MNISDLTIISVACVIGGSIVIGSLLSVVILLSRSNAPTRLVAADVALLCAIGLFLIFSLVNYTVITYEVAILGGLLAVISTLAGARMLSGGQR